MSSETAETYFRFDYINKAWRKSAKDDAMIKNMSSFFNPINFFNRRAKTEFFLGTSQVDAKRYLLVSEQGVRDIRTDLEAHLSTPLTFFPVAQNTVYTNMESFYIENAIDYNKIEKEIKSFNKAADASAKLWNFLQALATARQMYREKKYFFLAVDVESYERDHSCILEVGWSIHDARKDLFMDRHFCVEKYRHLKNGRYVSDAKDRFMFGKTVWASLEKISEEFLRDITLDGENDDKIVVLVGHDINMDVKYLEAMGKHMKDAIATLTRFDTAEMNAARVGKPNDRVSLGRLLDEFKIENYCLHNAGNDAHFTLLLFLELCKLPNPITATKVVATSSIGSVRGKSSAREAIGRKTSLFVTSKAGCHFDVYLDVDIDEWMIVDSYVK
ncbi:5732_t:CDS:2 [Ambispora gerdemannii]|uniref:5732_t:CDS:1 n=1 Tax=Ambispora gerdemannii TaxID=144530 RepID=A0A9N8ZAM8_9GLOM|nr:5732_t:CDS:2 [Ambispora gerdemannii]